MTGLKFAVRGFCFLAFLTGTLDMINGIGLLVAAGAPIQRLAHDPALNSQVRFWGAIWFGFGIVLWRASGRLRTEPGLFRILCAIIGLSGLARVVSAIMFGLPGAVLTIAMAIELAASVGFLLWHSATLRRPA